MKTPWVAILALAPAAASADNLIKDLSKTPQAEVAASCARKDWVACRELGERAHYGKGVTQDLAAAKWFYEQAKSNGDFNADGFLKSLELDRRCAALGAKVAEPGWIKEVEDCAVDYYEAKAAGKGDFKEAVECAQRAQQAETLAMLYANGQGVPRDIHRAIRAACEYRDVSAERDAMLEALFAIKESESDEPLDFCAHATSGHTAYRCAAYEADTTGDADEASLEKARAGWSPAALAEWQKLEPVAEAFFDAEASALTYGSRFGTAHAAMYQSAHTDLRHAFVGMMEGAATFDPAKAKDVGRPADVDRELNALYTQRLRSVDEPGEKEVIRVAERAWIRYRDATVTFFKAALAGRYPPETIVDAMQVRLTRDRVEQLRKE